MKRKKKKMANYIGVQIIWVRILPHFSRIWETRHHFVRELTGIVENRNTVNLDLESFSLSIWILVPQVYYSQLLWAYEFFSNFSQDEWHIEHSCKLANGWDNGDSKMISRSSQSCVFQVDVPCYLHQLSWFIILWRIFTRIIFLLFQERVLSSFLSSSRKQNLMNNVPSLQNQHVPNTKRARHLIS